MKKPLTPAGIEPATFRFVAQHLNHFATADQCGNQHYNRELLMMGIVLPETCWAYKKYNKIISGILLVFILQLSQWCTVQQTLKKTADSCLVICCLQQCKQEKESVYFKITYRCLEPYVSHTLRENVWSFEEWTECDIAGCCRLYELV